MDPIEDTAARKRRDAAEAWQEDPELEHLSRLQQEQPARYDAVPPTLKMSHGIYQAGKAAAEAEGRSR